MEENKTLKRKVTEMEAAQDDNNSRMEALEAKFAYLKENATKRMRTSLSY